MSGNIVFLRSALLAVSVLNLVATTCPGDLAAPANPVHHYNLAWTTPSKNSAGSMPIGNGDVGANVWVEEDGDLLFYIGKTDAWSGNCRLLKLGRVRVALTPNPFRAGRGFRQVLLLPRGEVQIQAGEEGSEVELRIWVDANRPVLRLEATGEQGFHLQVGLELWRNEKRELDVTAGKRGEIFSAFGLRGAPHSVYVYPDTILPATNDSVTWYHRNEISVWPETMELQGLGKLIQGSSDPLLGRTFGGTIRGPNLVSLNAKTLRSAKPRGRHTVSVYLLTSQTDTAKQWLSELDRTVSKVDATDIRKARRAHHEWWSNFWDRSWIHIVSSDPLLRRVSEAYNVWRYVEACTGRGPYPMKFNGLIFNVDVPAGIITRIQRDYDADYRDWGGLYWFQNTRLLYWPLLASGDLDMMQPLFEMYRQALPLARFRTQRYFGHEGAYFPETVYFWGAYANDNYGFNRKGKHVSEIDSSPMKWHFSGNLELLAMMLEYYRFAKDERFLKRSLLPMARELLLFFDRHYPRDKQGRLRMYPAQALEGIVGVANPAPDVAGLQWILDGLLSLPAGSVPQEDRRRWLRLRHKTPPLPLGERNGKQQLLPAEGYRGKSRSGESPQLYPTFPFKIFGLGKPGLGVAQNTFVDRPSKLNYCWGQDVIHAACLGLTREARDLMIERVGLKRVQRFPVFWGPYDWVPDGCHGGVTMLALQQMLMQCDGKKILLFPAWPKDWDVEFKLHGYGRTTVAGEYRDGRVQRLDVAPPARAKDVVRITPQ